MVGGGGLELLPRRRNILRVNQACQRCKTKKTRCDGKKPTCTNCENLRIECAYAPVRKHRGPGKSKQYIQDLETRLADMQSSLMQSGVPQAGASGENLPIESLGHTTVPESMANTHFPKIVPRLPKYPTVSQDPDPIQEQIREAIFPKQNADIFRVIKKRARAFKDNLRVEKFRPQVFAPLTSAQPNEHYIGPVFDEVMAPFPLFDWAGFEARLDDPESFNGAPWRACVYAVLALTTCFRAANSSFQDLHEGSLAYFKTGFAMFPELMVRGADLGAVEAIVMMALFARASPDTQTFSVLLNSATYLYQMLNIRAERSSGSFPSVEALRRCRVFAVICALNQELSCKYGIMPSMGSHELEPDLLEADDGRMPTAKMFYNRIRLVKIHSGIYEQLYVGQRNQLSRQQIIEIICQLELRLIQWRKDAWSIMGSEPDISALAKLDKAMTIHVVDLYLADNNGIQLMQWSLRRSQLGNGIDALRVGSGNGPQYVAVSKTRCAKSAKATLSLIPALDWVPFPTLWSFMGHFVSAFIIMFAIVVDDPTALEASSHISVMASFIESLELITKEHGFDLKVLLSFCAQMACIARSAVGAPDDWLPRGQVTQLAEAAQIVLRLVDEAIHPMSLVHNFMGNTKNKDYDTAMTLAAELSVSWDPTQRYGPFVPESLMPESYAFDFEDGKAT